MRTAAETRVVLPRVKENQRRHDRQKLRGRPGQLPTQPPKEPARRQPDLTLLGAGWDKASAHTVGPPICAWSCTQQTLGPSLAGRRLYG